jgi:hypothetical protein
MSLHIEEPLCQNWFEMKEAMLAGLIGGVRQVNFRALDKSAPPMPSSSRRYLTGEVVKSLPEELRSCSKPPSEFVAVNRTPSPHSQSSQ